MNTMSNDPEEEALANADEELLNVLEEVAMFTFQQTVYHLTKVRWFQSCRTFHVIVRFVHAIVLFVHVNVRFVHVNVRFVHVKVRFVHVIVLFDHVILHLFHVMVRVLVM